MRKLIDLPQVGLDVDGVVANFTQRVLEVMRATGCYEGESFYWQDYRETTFPSKTMMIELKAQPEFWRSILCFEGELVPFKPGAYITFRRPEHIALTGDWLGKHSLPLAPVYAARENKAIVAHMLGITHFVDDDPEIVMGMNDWGIKAFLLVRPWNEESAHDVPTIYSLDEMIAIVQGEKHAK